MSGVSTSSLSLAWSQRKLNETESRLSINLWNQHVMKSNCSFLVWITLGLSWVLPLVLGLDAWVFSLHLQTYSPPSLLPGHYAIIKGREEGRGGWDTNRLSPLLLRAVSMLERRQSQEPGRYQELDLFIKVLRLLCPNLTDASQARKNRKRN